MSDIGIPNPSNIAIRPLNKGMASDLASNVITAGGFITIQNYHNSIRGLKRRPGFSYVAGGNQLSSDDWPLLDVAALWTTGGANAAAILSNRYLYTLSGFAAPAQKYWTYSTGTISVTGTTVTGSGTAWNTAANRIQVGDVMILDADGAAEEAIIASIASDTSLTLTAAPTGTYGAGTDYTIRRRFQFSNDTFFDHIVVDNTLLVTDHYRLGLYAYNGTTLGAWTMLYDADLDGTTDTPVYYGSGCLAFVGDRIWLGNTIESGSYYRQRIRWSSNTDHTRFEPADYLDLPYTDGFLRRLLPLDRQLVAYFSDTIYVGRASNYTDLPYQFDTRSDSGSIGLVGTRAVTSAPNGHYFVGQDDVYFINSVDGIIPLDCPVKEEMIAACTRPERIYAVTDLAHDRVVFGFPRGGDSIERLWSYNYKLKAWSYDLVDAQFISCPHIDLSLTWDDLPTYLGANDNWDTGMASFGSWDAISAPSLSDSLFRANTGYVYYLNDSGSDDEGAAITGLLETPDMDFGDPDSDKTISRLTVRIANRTTTGLVFAVATSLDFGLTWEQQGSLIIEANESEGKINFVVTGSVVRIRLSESTIVVPYEIIEMTIRVLKRGKEYEFE